MNVLLVDIALLIQRIFFGGIMFLFHGSGKMGDLLSGNIRWSGSGRIGLGGEFEFILIALAEGVASLLVLLGLGTRMFAIPLVIGMLVAVTVAHANDPMPAARLGALNAYEHLTEEGKEIVKEEAEKSNFVAREIQQDLDAVEKADGEEAREKAISDTRLPLRSGTGELALLFLVGFLVLAIAGGGRFSLDRVVWPPVRSYIKKRREKKKEKKK